MPKRPLRNASAWTSAKPGLTRRLALKSYAKQMKDTALEDTAQRIRDRAIRRGGELLASMKASKGGRPSQKIRACGAP